jgi:hypothetical protein
VSRAAWTTLIASIIALGVVIGAVAAFVGGGDEETTATVVPRLAEARGFELPLFDQPGVLALAGHDRNLLVGIAARPGAPLEVAALRGEEPVPANELRVRVDGSERPVASCGRGCSRVSAPVLAGRESSVTVQHRGEAVTLDLPQRMPADGSELFDRARSTMSALQSFRYTERLSSGLGTTVRSTIDVQAPDRMRLRTKGFASVIIGKSRWDRPAGMQWEQSPFPGLSVPELLMWHDAKSPRVLRRRENGNTELVAWGVEPVPAWFRLEVEPSGRVAEAEMTAASHFMLHRYDDFDQGATITPPR